MVSNITCSFYLLINLIFQFKKNIVFLTKESKDYDECARFVRIIFTSKTLFVSNIKVNDLNHNALKNKQFCNVDNDKTF